MHVTLNECVGHFLPPKDELENYQATIRLFPGRASGPEYRGGSFILGGWVALVRHRELLGDSMQRGLAFVNPH
jgi:hypothetical protein